MTLPSRLPVVLGLSLSFAPLGACSSSDAPSQTAPQGGSTSQGGSSGSIAGKTSSDGGTGATGGTESQGGVVHAGGNSSAGQATGGTSAEGGTGPVETGPDGEAQPLGDVVYQQTFDALPVGLWKKNLDGSKIKAHPENIGVTEGCGPDGSSCLRVVYRHADGIHKQPFSSPVFTGSGASIEWTPSDAGHTNTSTDVLQANINIDGSTDGKSDADEKAIPGRAYTLTYDLFFEPGFDFAKGGKLPGLAAAEFDSGCSEEGSAKRQNGNWSERLMWRANGRLQLYSYDQSRKSGGCGVEKTIDEVEGDPKFEQPGVVPQNDKFRLLPGVWYHVMLSVRVNDNDSVTYLMDAEGKPALDENGELQPLGGNGAVSLNIQSADGKQKRQLVFSGVAVRDECNGTCPATVPDSPGTQVNGLFFSTFFGGNETKRTTCIDLQQSSLTELVAAKPPTYATLTQERFDQLCRSQMNPAIFPVLTWDPQTPSAARFDNFVVKTGYTGSF